MKRTASDREAGESESRTDSSSCNISANASTSSRFTNSKTYTKNNNHTPSINNSDFCFGPYVPILRPDKCVIIDSTGIVLDYAEHNPNHTRNRLISEVLPDDTIVEAPSLVTPLLLKKKTVWPPRQDEENDKEEESGIEGRPKANEDDSDDIQIVKIVKKESSARVENKNRKLVQDYIKSAAIASLTKSATPTNPAPILTIEDYYKSSVGELLLGIGISRVLEYTNEENIKRLNRNIRRDDEYTSSRLSELSSLKERQTAIQNNNRPFKPQEIYSCPNCDFKTGFQIVLDGHLETPHMDRKSFLCNWCDYKTKDPSHFIYHNIYQHKKRSLLERPPSNYNCHLCSYETRHKRLLVSHLAKCEASFNINTSLSALEIGELDFPAVTTKLINQEDVKTYDQTLRALRLAAYNPHQLKVPVAHPNGTRQSSVYVIPRTPGPNNMGRQQALLFRSPNPQQPQASQPNVIMGPADLVRRAPAPSPTGTTSSQLMNLLATHNIAVAPTKSAIVQHPQIQSSFANGRAVIRSVNDLMMSPSNNGQSSSSKQDNEQSASASRSKKGLSRVLCEICDFYLKDVNKLKRHMLDAHETTIRIKVMNKDSKKMYATRPPLSCQRCDWRFFTDQGLERHLLCTHSLVTDNMQHQVERNLDAGRCSICSQSISTGLVAHVKDFHRLNLKPAHLTYKCTVCTATFNLYQQFENHVFITHREQVREPNITK